MKYRVMTYNIQSCKNFITKEFNHKFVSDVINKYKPDILGLNEVRTNPIKYTLHPSWFNQTEKIAKYCNFKHYFFGKSIELEGYYGNSLLSNYEIDNPIVYKVEDPIIKDEDCLYETRSIIVSYINNIKVIVTHMGLAKAERCNLIKKLIEIIDSSNSPIILMGDFNTENKDELKEIYDRLIDANYKDDNYKTYNSINPTIKIDYIFISKDINLLNVFIPYDIASDHLPVICDVEIK